MKYATAMYVLCIPDFPRGDISYFSGCYGTDVMGHVDNDICPIFAIFGDKERLRSYYYYYLLGRRRWKEIEVQQDG